MCRKIKSRKKVKINQLFCDDNRTLSRDEMSPHSQRVLSTFTRDHQQKNACRPTRNCTTCLKPIISHGRALRRLTKFNWILILCWLVSLSVFLLDKTTKSPSIIRLRCGDTRNTTSREMTKTTAAQDKSATWHERRSSYFDKKKWDSSSLRFGRAAVSANFPEFCV